MPPWLRFSVSAAAIVLPKRYWIGNAEHDARAAAAVEVVGKQVRRERRQDVLHGAVLVDVAGDAERRELAHFVGAGDRAAEDQDRQPPVVELADRPDQIDARRVRQPQVEDDEIDLVEIGADARQQLGRALDRRSPGARRPRAPRESGRGRTPCRRRRRRSWRRPRCWPSCRFIGTL